MIDLSSIKRDFERCKDMCEKLVAISFDNELDGTVVDAPATTIPVVYSRPFNGVARTRVNELIDEFDEADLTLPKQITEMRSKFSAHSVNGMEQEIMRVWLNPEERGGRKINNVNTAANVLLALSGNEYAHLIRLCEKALAWVSAQFENEAINAQKIELPDSWPMKESAPVTPVYCLSTFSTEFHLLQMTEVNHQSRPPTVANSESRFGGGFFENLAPGSSIPDDFKI